MLFAAINTASPSSGIALLFKETVIGVEVTEVVSDLLLGVGLLGAFRGQTLEDLIA